MNSEHESSTKESILARIERDHVRMYSRGHFLLRLIGVIVLAILILIFSVFICNFVFFTLRLNGHDALPGFGGNGIILFLKFFPWPLLILDLLLIILLRYVLGSFPRAYRTPWIYLFLIFLALSVSLGLALDRSTNFNDSLLQRSDHGHLPPPFGNVYQNARHPIPPGSGAYRGIVTSVASSSIVINDPDKDAPLTIMLTPMTQRPHEPLSIGEAVFVIGKQTGEKIEAEVIHPINKEGISPEPE